MVANLSNKTAKVPKGKKLGRVWNLNVGKRVRYIEIHSNRKIAFRLIQKTQVYHKNIENNNRGIEMWSTQN